MEVLKYITLAILACTLSACYQDFNPDLDTRPVLCLNSIITAGQPVEVSVTHTWKFNDVGAENNHTVPDAVVTVYANGLQQDASYIPAEGDEIRIVAHSATYGEAEATVTVPSAATIVAAEFLPTVNYAYHGDNSEDDFVLSISFGFRLKLTIEDDPATADFFQFRRYAYAMLPDDPNYYYEPRYFTDYFPGEIDYEAEPIFGEHIGVFDYVMGTADGGYMIFSDRQFSGNSYTVTLNFTDGWYGVCWPGNYADSPDYADKLFDCGVVIDLATVSRSYYDRAMYLFQVNEGVIGDLGDLGFADPVWGYSNVSTGAGVVAARTFTEYNLNLKDFLRQAADDTAAHAITRLGKPTFSSCR